MKYSDRFFKFPVRIYDRFLTERALKLEETIDAPSEGEWRTGIVRVPYYDIASWSDFFDSEQGPEGVDEDGYMYTIVWTHENGSFISTWNRKKYEEELNKHVEAYEKWAQTVPEEMKTAL